MKKQKIYFASPFFNETQVEREERLKKKLRDLGYEVFSPKESCHLGSDASVEQQTEVFNSNVQAILDCDIVFAVTDEKDMGTIWESGFSYALKLFSNKNKKIAYYCETLKGGKFNLMLARSADLVVTNFDDMDNFVSMIENGNDYSGKIE